MIPISDADEALRAADGAEEAGPDGIFLENRGIGYQKLLRIAQNVATRHPCLFIGVHCLDLRPQDVFCRLSEDIRGVWTDHDITVSRPPATPAAIATARQESGWGGLHFVGIPSDNEGSAAARDTLAMVHEYADVITLTAPGTRGQPSMGKLPHQHEAIGTYQLRIVASMTTECTQAEEPYVDRCVAFCSAVNNRSTLDVRHEVEVRDT